MFGPPPPPTNDDVEEADGVEPELEEVGDGDVCEELDNVDERVDEEVGMGDELLFSGEDDGVDDAEAERSDDKSTQHG